MGNLLKHSKLLCGELKIVGCELFIAFFIFSTDLCVLCLEFERSKSF